MHKSQAGRTAELKLQTMAKWEKFHTEKRTCFYLDSTADS